MIRVSVLYPNSEGATFDIDYYVTSHMPMVESKLGSALKGWSAEYGIAGGAPGEPAPYLASGHLTFDSVEDFQNSFGPNQDAILADVPNYTQLQPVFQIAEIKAG
jgi:uncharacterized protein (TIGR02118 family)